MQRLIEAVNLSTSILLLYRIESLSSLKNENFGMLLHGYKGYTILYISHFHFSLEPNHIPEYTVAAILTGSLSEI